MSFLAPLFLAGAALVGAPFLIHRIRRPERDPIKFSSLLFVPDVKKEVIERRRVQHIILMMMRMAMLLLLAAAFSRPFWSSVIATETEDRAGRHLVLLDTSFSMGQDDLFDAAKDAALDVLDGVDNDDAVAAMTFAQTADVAATFSTTGDDRALARRAIRDAELSYERTDYAGALQFAQRVLTDDLEGDAIPLHVYVVSDFQREGMPEVFTGWKLGSGVTLHPVAVSRKDAPNLGITDVGVRRTSSGDFRVLGKIKNWSNENVNGVEVQLVIDNDTTQTLYRDIRAGNASQVSFLLESDASDSMSGHILLADDALMADNRRFFAWAPPRKHRIVLTAEHAPAYRDSDAEFPWPAAWFLMSALPASNESPFELEFVPFDELADALSGGSRPSAVVACEPNADAGAALDEFVAAGGQVLAIGAGDSVGVSALGGALLHRGTPDPSNSSSIAWVNFSHEIFLPFSGERFNDFSTLRFYNFATYPDHDSKVRALAQFDDGSPAILEAEVGDGRMIVWPFALRLDWTNLPKNARFVPLLYETMAYLCDVGGEARRWTVGDRLDVAALGAADVAFAVLPGDGDVMEVSRADAPAITAPGIVRYGDTRSESSSQALAVNVDADEGDTTPIDPAEFELKLASAPALFTNQPAGSGDTLDANILKHEFGYFFLIAMVVVLAAESWYMSTLKE